GTGSRERGSRSRAVDARTGSFGCWCAGKCAASEASGAESAVAHATLLVRQEKDEAPPVRSPEFAKTLRPVAPVAQFGGDDIGTGGHGEMGGTGLGVGNSRSRNWGRSGSEEPRIPRLSRILGRHF